MRARDRELEGTLMHRLVWGILLLACCLLVPCARRAESIGEEHRHTALAIAPEDSSTAGHALGMRVLSQRSTGGRMRAGIADAIQHTSRLFFARPAQDMFVELSPARNAKFRVSTL